MPQQRVQHNCLLQGSPQLSIYVIYGPCSGADVSLEYHVICPMGPKWAPPILGGCGGSKALNLTTCMQVFEFVPLSNPYNWDMSWQLVQGDCE